MTHLKDEKTISDTAVARLIASPRALGRIMVILNRTESTVKNYASNKRERLMIPEIITIIAEETGLTEEEIIIPLKTNSKIKAA